MSIPVLIEQFGYLPVALGAAGFPESFAGKTSAANAADGSFPAGFAARRLAARGTGWCHFAVVWMDMRCCCVD